MFIAHLPAGYLVASRARDRWTWAAILVGSIAPDVDMLWFYLVDEGRVHHHAYATHWPITWALFAFIGVALRKSIAGRAFVGLGVGGLLHMMLDTFVGDVRWLAPISERAFHLVEVHAVSGQHWVLNFVLHWSFTVEVAVVLSAALLFAKRWRNRVSSTGEDPLPGVPGEVSS